MNFFEKINYNFKQQSVLTQIIVANVVIFLTINLVGNISRVNLLPFFALPISSPEWTYKFWTLFLYMFTHEGLGHLFWNMILFYFMSQLFLNLMGQKKILYLYVMSGIFGAALVLVLGLIFPSSFSNTFLIGASASVLGIGAVLSIYSPHYKVNLFGLIELSYVYFYLITFIISTLIDLSSNTGGKISHIGGAAFGLIYGYYLKKGIDLFNFSFKIKNLRKLKIVSHNKENNNTEAMDKLLDKISKSGYEGLTTKEKEELFKLSQKK